MFITDKAKAWSSSSDVTDKMKARSSANDVTAHSSVGGEKSMTASVGATVNRQLRSKKSKILNLLQYA